MLHGVVAERRQYQHTAGWLYDVCQDSLVRRTMYFVNNRWCTISKEVSSYCSLEVEYIMISCRPHYLPREFSSLFFVAVYIPPQSEVDTKTALNELYSTISKQENAHPEAALLVTGDCNAGKLKLILPTFSMLNVVQREKNSGPPILHKQRPIKSSPSPSIWQI